MSTSEPHEFVEPSTANLLKGKLNNIFLVKLLRLAVGSSFFDLLITNLEASLRKVTVFLFGFGLLFFVLLAQAAELFTPYRCFKYFEEKCSVYLDSVL